MNLKPTVTTPKSKMGSGWITTVIILLLLAVAVMVIMTGKRFLEAQQTTTQELDVKQYTQVVNNNPDNVTARLGLAYSFQQAERYDEAKEQYLEVLSVEPKNQAALFNLGEIARINKDFGEAQSRYKELLKNYKYHVLGSVSLANVYIETKKYDDAIKLMDEMIAGVPRIIDFHLVKADALIKKGDKAKAKESYNQVLKYDPLNQTAKEGLAKLK